MQLKMWYKWREEVGRSFNVRDVRWQRSTATRGNRVNKERTNALLYDSATVVGEITVKFSRPFSAVLAFVLRLVLSPSFSNTDSTLKAF